MARQKARRYECTGNAIGYECASSWMRAECDDGVVCFDKHGYVPLNADQCRDLARWLMAAAGLIEDKRGATKDT